MVSRAEVPRAGGRFRTVLPNALTLALAIALCLPLAELLLRLLLPAPSVYRALPPNLEARFDGGWIPGVKGSSLYKVNSMGARGREWSADRDSEFRLLCMGGSTTEGLVNDQSRVWTSLLEQKLGTMPDGRRAWVGNIGRSGLSTRHHVVQATHLLDVYDPDCVVLLAGINDLTSRLRQDGDYDPFYAEKPESGVPLLQQSFAVSPGRFASEYVNDSWWKRTRLWLLLRLVKYQILRMPELQDPRGSYLVRWRQLRARGRRSSVLPPLGPALDEYAHNLREILRLLWARRIRAILMTQPVLWRSGMTENEKKLLWMGGVGDFRSGPGSLYYEPEALAEGMDAYNARLRQVCRETGAECVDLVEVIPQTTEYLWDDCHFTDKAQVEVAEAVARTILAPRREEGAAAPRSAYRGGPPASPSVEGARR